MIKVLFSLLLLVTVTQGARLPKDVIPSRQYLHLKFDMDQWTYAGLTTIDIDVTQRRDNIWLYASAKHINMTEISLHHQEGENVRIAKAVANTEKKTLSIKPVSAIEPGKYKLEIRFHGKVREVLQGMIRTGYVDSHGHKHKQVTTHFEPDKAREAFPCFDEPSFRVRITLVTEHPEHYKTNSAAPVQSRSHIGDGNVRTTFEETLPISVYLFAIDVHDMTSVAVRTKRGIPVTVLTPEYAKEAALRTAKLAARSLDWFEGFLGVDYAFKKLDLIGIFDFNAGGMENVGLIHLMYDCAYGTRPTLPPSSFLYCQTVVVHEVSHMWFGDLVSLKWWDDLWLKEGFARFISPYAQDHMEGNHRSPGAHELTLQSRGYLSGIKDDQYRFTKPVRQKLENSYAAAAMFNNLSYSKASWILRAIQKLIGDETFQKGLQKYFKKYQLKSANFYDFTGCFDEITPTVSVRKFMESWLNEPGFPLVKIEKETPQTIVFTQSRYTPTMDYYTDQKWVIPINFKSDAENATQYILWQSRQGRHTYKEPFNWFLHDTLNTEFVVFQYDKEDMMELARTLQENCHVLTPMQRTMYTSNLIQNFNNGRVDLDTMLETSRYIVNEPNGRIIQAWTFALLGIKREIYLPQNRLMFERYFKTLLIDRIRLTMSKEIEETRDWNIIKYYRLMFYFGVRWKVAEARKRSKRVIQEFFQGNHVNVVYLSYVLKFYSRHRSWKKVFKLLDWYPRSIKEYETILAAVCKTTDPHYQLYILNYSKESEVMPRSLKARTVCYVASRNAPLAWKWFKKNYDFYFNMYGESQFTFNSLLSCVTEHLTTRRQYDDVNRFFSGRSTGTGVDGLKRGKEQIRENLVSREDEREQDREDDYDKIFSSFVERLYNRSEDVEE